MSPERKLGWGFTLFGLGAAGLMAILTLNYPVVTHPVPLFVLCGAVTLYGLVMIVHDGPTVPLVASAVRFWKWIRGLRLRWPVYLRQGQGVDLAQLAFPIATQQSRELEVCQNELKQHLDVMKYGNACFPAGLPSLSAADLRFLAETMTELRPFVDNATVKLGDVFEAGIRAMQLANKEEPQTDARYWLARGLEERQLSRLKNVSRRFDETVNAEQDSREAFAAILDEYERVRRWTEAMCVFLGKEMSTLHRFGEWKQANKQLVVQTEKALTLPQLSAVGYWLNSSTRLDAITREGLPSAPNSVALPPPESAS